MIKFKTQVKMTGYCKLAVNWMSIETGVTHHGIHWLVEKVSILFNKLVNYPPEGEKKTKTEFTDKIILSSEKDLMLCIRRKRYSWF